MSSVDLSTRAGTHALVVRWGVLALLAFLILVTQAGHCPPVQEHAIVAAATGHDDHHGPCVATTADDVARAQSRHLGSPLPQLTAAPHDPAPTSPTPSSNAVAHSPTRAGPGVSGAELLTALGVART